MNNYLLAFLGLVLLIFCVVDLFHLKEMLKELRDIRYYISELHALYCNDRQSYLK